MDLATRLAVSLQRSYLYPLYRTRLPSEVLSSYYKELREHLLREHFLRNVKIPVDLCMKDYSIDFRGANSKIFDYSYLITCPLVIACKNAIDLQNLTALPSFEVLPPFKEELERFKQEHLLRNFPITCKMIERQKITGGMLTLHPPKQEHLLRNFPITCKKIERQKITGAMLTLHPPYHRVHSSANAIQSLLKVVNKIKSLPECVHKSISCAAHDCVSSLLKKLIPHFDIRNKRYGSSVAKGTAMWAAWHQYPKRIKI